MSDSEMAHEVSAGASLDRRQPARDYQMATLALPPNNVLEEIGRAAVRFGQLEHLLKLIHKRTSQGILLHTVLEMRVGLGGFLTGATALGETIEFEGLIKLAKENPQLSLILDQFNKATGLVKMRNKYLHNGIGSNAAGKFIFLKSGEELDHTQMIMKLRAASELSECLLSEINSKIPPDPTKQSQI